MYGVQKETATANTQGGSGNMQYWLWCDLCYIYEPASPTCPSSETCEVREVHECHIDVDGHEFHLYDLGSIEDFMRLWDVDVHYDALSWEPCDRPN